MTVPWLLTTNTAPWLASQPIYPRTVAVHRNKTVAGTSDAIGGVGYSGTEQGVGASGENILFTGLQAWVQLVAGGRTTKSGGLPTDAVTKPVWTIYIPVAQIPPIPPIVEFSIRDRDIIVDDEFYRYEVSGNFWTPAGYQLSTIREEV